MVFEYNDKAVISQTSKDIYCSPVVWKVLPEQALLGCRAKGILALLKCLVTCSSLLPN